jgi:hypothetical protein
MAMAFQRAMTLHYVSATQSQVRIMQERSSADDLTA